MAKPNYKQQKRQKELARKTRQDEKLAKRMPRAEGDVNLDGGQQQADGGVPLSTDQAAPGSVAN
jgi:hypothetical protein